MEQVLNRVDRNQAFIKFLIFFLVTIVLTVAAIFVNYKLPSKENSKLREQAELRRQEDAGELKFLAIMKEAVDLQDSMREGGMKAVLNSKIGNLYQISQSDNTSYGQLNKVIAKKLQEIEDQKDRISSIIKSNEAKYTSMQIDLQNCQKALALSEQKPVTPP
jgi:Type VI secretion system, TssO